MLNNVPVLTTLPATDINRAKEFYEDKLGLTIEEFYEDMMVLDANGVKITVYERPTPTKADHTVMTFEVKDIENEIKGLKTKGVIFEDYDMPDLNLKTDKNHVAVMENDKAAWFKDSEGNILCLHETLVK